MVTNLRSSSCCRTRIESWVEEVNFICLQRRRTAKVIQSDNRGKWIKWDTGVASFSTSCRPGWLSFPHILKIARKTLKLFSSPQQPAHNLLQAVEWSNQTFVAPGLRVYGLATPLWEVISSDLRNWFVWHLSVVLLACEAQTYFRSSLLSLFRRERSDDRKYVCASQVTVLLAFYSFISSPWKVSSNIMSYYLYCAASGFGKKAQNNMTYTNLKVRLIPRRTLVCWSSTTSWSLRKPGVGIKWSASWEKNFCKIELCR